MDAQSAAEREYPDTDYMQPSTLAVVRNAFVEGAEWGRKEALQEAARSVESLEKRLQTQAAIIERYQAAILEQSALPAEPVDPDPRCDICGDPITPSLGENSWVHTATGRAQGFVRRPHWAEQKKRRSTDV